MKEFSELRKHQSQAKSIAQALVDEWQRRGVLEHHGRTDPYRNCTSAYVVTGGGKSYLNWVFADTLYRAGAIASAVMVNPRSSLVDQAKRQFTPHFQKVANWDQFPFRNAEKGQYGYITTYQSVASVKAGATSTRADANFHRAILEERGPYLVILDEAHHTVDEKEWERSVEILCEGAAHVLLVTGSGSRSDGRPIPRVRYVESESGGEVPAWDIEYRRVEALNDGVIRSINFQAAETHVKVDAGRNHEEYEGTLYDAPADIRRKALRVALDQDDYRLNDIVFPMLDHWQAHRHFLRSKGATRTRALVICRSQQEAKRTAAAIRQEYNPTKVVLAISDEGDTGRKALNDFRDHGVGEVLVTCHMAYEGLDCPDLTHVAHCGDIRSIEWNEQAFGRVVRVDNHEKALAPDLQKAFAWFPYDYEMAEVVREIQEDQARSLAERQERERPEIQEPEERPAPELVTGEAKCVGWLVGDMDKRAAPQSGDAIVYLRSLHPDLTGLSAEVLGMIPVIPPEKHWRKDRERSADQSDIPLDEQENALKNEIEKYCKNIDRVSVRRGRVMNIGGVERPWGKYAEGMNGLLRRRFRKSRSAMSVDELQKVLDYVEAEWRRLIG